MLDALKNTDDPEHKEMMEWLEGEFDPEEFDVDGVNLELIGYFE